MKGGNPSSAAALGVVTSGLLLRVLEHSDILRLVYVERVRAEMYEEHVCVYVESLPRISAVFLFCNIVVIMRHQGFLTGSTSQFVWLLVFELPAAAFGCFWYPHHKLPGLLMLFSVVIDANQLVRFVVSRNWHVIMPCLHAQDVYGMVQVVTAIATHHQ